MAVQLLPAEATGAVVVACGVGAGASVGVMAAALVDVTDRSRGWLSLELPHAHNAWADNSMTSVVRVVLLTSGHEGTEVLVTGGDFVGRGGSCSPATSGQWWIGEVGHDGVASGDELLPSGPGSGEDGGTQGG